MKCYVIRRGRGYLMPPNSEGERINWGPLNKAEFFTNKKFAESELVNDNLETVIAVEIKVRP